MRYLYALLALVPVAFVLEYLVHASPLLIFTVSALALVPLAAVLGRATEELAVHTGPRIGGLLNATLGNAAELIITIVALNAGLIELVKASITGSILGNILIVLGASLLIGGLKNGVQHFDRTEAGIVAALLLLSVIAILVPTFFARTVGENIVTLSEEVSVIMILMYAAYLTYSFLSSPRMAVQPAHGGAGGETTSVSLDNARPEPAQRAGHGNGASRQEHESTATAAHGEGHASTWSLTTSLGVLAVSTVAIVFMSEFVVGAVEHVTEQLGWSEFFLGVLVIPLVGNVAEHIVGVQVAYKNQMDLSLAISLGSSLQVALFVAPVLVFVSLFVGEAPMDLVFTTFETIALIAAVAVGAIVSLDGESNWLEGALLIGVYAILGFAFFYVRT
ncbi:MAG: calcium/proton exchanger [Chloroflexota bacterium]|nr:calcium/proton exchanger [Chloroflexota bacterium]